MGNYLGSTALKTQAVINEAMGGVLFIDEAYSLCAKDDVYGSEAIATLLKAMEDHRDDLVVIIAGYEEPIRKLINSNPGLASRFARFIRFPDYTAEELFQVLEQMCRKSDYCLDPAAEAPLRALLEDKVRRKGEHFANAREVRNLFDAARTRQTLRIAGLKDADDQTYRTLTAEDFGLVPGKEQA